MGKLVVTIGVGDQQTDSETHHRTVPALALLMPLLLLACVDSDETTDGPSSERATAEPIAWTPSDACGHRYIILKITPRSDRQETEWTQNLRADTK